MEGDVFNNTNNSKGWFGAALDKLNQARDATVSAATVVKDRTVQGAQFIGTKTVEASKFVVEKTTVTAKTAADATASAAAVVKTKTIEGATLIKEKTAVGAEVVRTKTVQGAAMIKDKTIEMVDSANAKMGAGLMKRENSKRSMNSKHTNNNNNNSSNSSSAEDEEALNATRVFGVPLEMVLARESERGRIPKVVDRMIYFIEANGLNTEGIFRVPGNKNKINAMKAQIDKGEDVVFGLDSHDVNDVAALLKLFLKELPAPLLTYELYDDFKSTMAPGTPYDTLEKKTHRLRELIYENDQMPAANRHLLARLMRLMYTVLQSSDQNKMTANNLAIVFALNVLRPREAEPDPSVLLRETDGITRVFEHLINQYIEIFVAPTLVSNNSTPLV